MNSLRGRSALSFRELCAGGAGSRRIVVGLDKEIIGRKRRSAKQMFSGPLAQGAHTAVEVKPAGDMGEINVCDPTRLGFNERASVRCR